jgi:hypothetical protein
MDCDKKFNIYLLYSGRPKNLNKTYRIHVDAYNKIDMSYYSSWMFPIQFAFLPVNRISTLLTLPATSITSQCSKFCGHGQCLSYVNIENEFCLCNSGWSGEQCTIPLNCTCSSGSRCFLSSICQQRKCLFKKDVCISIDSNDQTYTCLYWQNFLGDVNDHVLK